MNLRDALRSSSPTKRKQILRLIEDATEEEALDILLDWSWWARPAQLPPGGEWFVWLILAGRGWGKTATGAQWVKKQAEEGKCRRIALVSDTAADVRDVMVEGVSGILSVSHPNFMPLYEPSKRRLTWPNGVKAFCYAAESPEALRGPAHDKAWCDEPAKWKNLRKRDTEGGTAWDNLLMGLREGIDPRCCCTTTPRAIPWMKKLKARKSTVVTGGSSYENIDNLSHKWFEEVIGAYEGTRLGKQEIHAQILEDVEGALWTLATIEKWRVQSCPPLVRVVTAFDPSVSNTERSDECGIVTAGKDAAGHVYVLDDSSLVALPADWAKTGVQAGKTRKADKFVGEANNGGDMVELTLRTVDKNLPFKKVNASQGKRTRAEPVAALYEQGKVHHVGSFALMEDEMTTWVPGEKSPNRMDALVWAVSELVWGREYHFGLLDKNKAKPKEEGEDDKKKEGEEQKEEANVAA